ncbi:hypothetical protein SALBM311S_08579 [Streptomyces alboniger]
MRSVSRASATRPNASVVAAVTAGDGVPAAWAADTGSRAAERAERRRRRNGFCSYRTCLISLAVCLMRGVVQRTTVDQSGDCAGSSPRRLKVSGFCTSSQSASSLKDTHLTSFFVQTFLMTWSTAFM